MLNELLDLDPCPFCGVRLKKYNGCGCGTCKGGVWHDNAKCILGSKIFSGHMSELDLKEFAEKWNMRPNLPAKGRAESASSD